VTSYAQGQEQERYVVGSSCIFFRELTLLRRIDVLAERLVPWEPLPTKSGWRCWRNARTRECLDLF
jgi:hypothetical protein